MTKEQEIVLQDNLLETFQSAGDKIIEQQKEKIE